MNFLTDTDHMICADGIINAHVWENKRWLKSNSYWDIVINYANGKQFRAVYDYHQKDECYAMMEQLSALPKEQP